MGDRCRLWAVALTAVWLSACACGKPAQGTDAGPDPVDAGDDAGVDAGPPVDAGVDGGMDPDAGPPPELKILKVLPPRGGASGGTPVTLQGSGFIRDFSTTGSEAKRVTTLKLGGNPVIDFQIIDDETLELRTPPGVAGSATVAITNPLGTYKCNSCFTYFDELALTSVAPAAAPLRGGAEVTLSGNGFTADMEVLFGVFSSPKVTLVSSTSVKAVVPRGAAPGLVDLTVYNKNGVATLRRGFRYAADLKVTGAAPLTLPLQGGAVTLSGQGFSGATAVKFGAVDASSFTVESDGVLKATAAGVSTPGLVDVTIVTPLDSVTWRGIAFVDPTGAFAVFGVVPHVGAPGETVTLVGQGLDASGLTASLGGVSAAVGAQTFGTAVLTVPARGAAPRKSDVAATAGANSGSVTGGFTWRLSLESIAPVSGPAAGGTAVHLAGKALPADVQVFVGALPAVKAAANPEDSADVVTAPGSGGAPVDVRVREAADPENEAVLAAAYTYEEKLALGRVQPDRGAIAGGTLVTVLGAGFGDGTIVTFGDKKAKDVKVVDSHTITCRTPRGDVGVVDVLVDRLTAHDDLLGGFSYFDPRSISGGLSGGPLVGTLNITVLDATQGFYGAPVPQAQVILGVDPGTPFQGLTDARGQITFSDPGLVKAQTATIFKTNYESATVTSINAENLTVFISRTGGGDGSPGNPPPGPPPSTISGKVTGFKAPRVLNSGESLEARVFVAQTSLFGGPPFGGPPNKSSEKWQVVKEGGEYLVKTGAGLRAVYAILGIANSVSKKFEPVSMGLRRGITTSPDQPAVNQDIVIDQHLDLTVPVTIDSPLFEVGPSGMAQAQNNSVYAWLDLGAEGFVPNPNNWDTGTAAQSSVAGHLASYPFPNFPRLDGTNFIFLNESTTTAYYPASYYFRRQPGDLSLGVTIGPMLPAPRIFEPMGTFTGVLKWGLPAGPTADIHQVQILKQTLLGAISVWSVVLPGTETQVVLPPPAVTKLQTEEAGNQLFVVIYSSRSPKFAYNQWTYDTLSGVSWSSFTIALSAPFTP
ncbi:MAG: IPT/TIG domain-containing protein [Myxococcaceae bacterium]|nr:IPT/TIG domain-containing protein [Myxococcaceae bacterium]